MSITKVQSVFDVLFAERSKSDGHEVVGLISKYDMQTGYIH